MQKQRILMQLGSKPAIWMSVLFLCFATLSVQAELVFEENFEMGGSSWSIDNGVWEVGTPMAGPAGCYEGVQCAGTALIGTYPANTDSRLISPPIDLPRVATNEVLLLRFWQWYSYSSGDVGQGQVARWDGTAWGAWEVLATPTGDGVNSGWAPVHLDVTAYAGQRIQLGFYHTATNVCCGSDLDVGAGWFIDEVELRSGSDRFNNPEDFEASWGDWYTDNFQVWQIGIPTSGPPAVSGSRAHSPVSVAATVLSGNYPANTTGRLMSPRFTVPSVAGDNRVLLRFWQWYQYGTGDSGEIQIQTQFDPEWTTLQISRFNRHLERLGVGVPGSHALPEPGGPSGLPPYSEQRSFCRCRLVHQ